MIRRDGVCVLLVTNQFSIGSSDTTSVCLLTLHISKLTINIIIRQGDMVVGWAGSIFRKRKDNYKSNKFFVRKHFLVCPQYEANEHDGFEFDLLLLLLLLDEIIVKE